ncbi:MAG: Rab family GTPase [Candidatus Hodarchaeota archaeon]
MNKQVFQDLPTYRGKAKIGIVGATGSGKTSFVKMLLGEYFDPIAEEKRCHIDEEKSTLTYTIIDENLLAEDSTTTVSMNLASILLIITTYNTLEFLPLERAAELVNRTDIDYFWQVLFVDTAGQERFDFIPEIAIPGSNGAILFADGTNISSMRKLTYYINLIRQEEERTGEIVPIAVFLNKSDLLHIYGGIESLSRVISIQDLLVYETSIKDQEGFVIPLRLLISVLKPRDSLLSRSTNKKTTISAAF